METLVECWRVDILTKKTSFFDIDCEFVIGECGEVFGKLKIALLSLTS